MWVQKQIQIGVHLTPWLSLNVCYRI